MDVQHVWMVLSHSYKHSYCPGYVCWTTNHTIGKERWDIFWCLERRRKTGLRHVTFIVRERQLRLYGHVARLLADDPVNRILFCHDLSGWIMPKGRPQASCLRQVESWAWRLSGRWPDGGRSTVAKWTRRRPAPAYLPTPDLT